MISFIRGKIVQKLQDSVIIDHMGIGIEIFVPQTILQTLAFEEVQLFTYFKVTDEAMSLYGFTSREELELFKMLISVSGIGPRGGISLLSYFTENELKAAIAAEDTKSISCVHGIGVKMAKRIVLELKDKIDLESIIPVSKTEQEEGLTEGRAEAVAALVALGYSSGEAKKAVQKAEAAEDASADQILKAALSYLI